MNLYVFFPLLLITHVCIAQDHKPIKGVDRTIPFDDNWRFKKDTLHNGYESTFDDLQWRKLDLPHDWSIEDLPNQIAESVAGPFHKQSVSGTSTGFTVGGTGWYRKTFVMKNSTPVKRVIIYFDGVYMNSDVWVNGKYLGNHPNGYTPFYYDLTPFLLPPGGENLIAVRVRNEGKNSRWYTGSGIYRHVWLTLTNDVFIVPLGVYVGTPEVSEKNAVVRINSTINNNGSSLAEISLVTSIIAPNGETIASTEKRLRVQMQKGETVAQDINIPSPSLWSPDSPAQYKVNSVLKRGNEVLDFVETSFGVRSVKMDAKYGLTLNGKKIVLKGGCIHHDNGPLGAAAIDRAEERKVEILKKNGFNAIRTSHNPPSQQFLEYCDRLGLLVVEEAFDMWEVAKNPQDYHVFFKEKWRDDLDAMIRRDRNHPSVIVWSIGNEIAERVDTSGLRITRQLVDEAHKLDPTRLVTESLCVFWEKSNQGKAWDETEKAFALLDVAGYNYEYDRYAADHEKYPNRIIIGTESHPQKALENWNCVERDPYVVGDFVWTAFDYLGEASIGNSNYDSVKKVNSNLGWPWKNAWCGDIDLIGNKKVQSYYRDVVWRRIPIAMAVHAPIPVGLVENISAWGWPNESLSWTWGNLPDTPLKVRVFSRAKLVRLKLNGKVVGEQTIVDGNIVAEFTVKYQPGTLTAVNVVDGNETEAFDLKTSGSPRRIRLSADRPEITPSRNDLCYVMVEVVDDNGLVVLTSSENIRFTITGVGEIAAVGNANPTETASFQKPERKTFNGRCMVIVRPTGERGTIRLQAQSDRLKGADVIIKVSNK